MNTANLIIRHECPADHAAVERLVREAFWNVYRPGCLEHYLLHVLRSDPSFIPALDFILERDGAIIGQAAFVHGSISANDGRTIPVLTLGPISIAPEYHRQGYGKYLLNYALEQARAYGGAVCLEGNINFYGKCGFVPGSRFGLHYRGMPEGMDAPFFLVCELEDGYLAGITGEYGPAEVYDVDEANAEVYDKAFPPKVKLKLPGQLV